MTLTILFHLLQVQLYWKTCNSNKYFTRNYDDNTQKKMGILALLFCNETLSDNNLERLKEIFIDLNLRRHF